MKIKLLDNVTVPLTKGTVVEVDNALAMWLVSTYRAVCEDGKETKETTTKKPAEKRTKKNTKG